MSDPSESEPTPPEPSTDVARVGQAQNRSVSVINSGVPKDSRIAELPSILLDGAREAVHSELTWKLISKIASQGEDERRALKHERDTARSEVEHWRGRAEDLARELVALRARWESVSTLTNAQAVLYVVGGILIGPVMQDLLAGNWVPQTITVALLGVAAVLAGYLLGKIGPRRTA